MDLESYTVPDFCNSELEFNNEKQKKTIWQMLSDHVSGKNSSQKMAKVISLLLQEKDEQICHQIMSAKKHVGSTTGSTRSSSLSILSERLSLPQSQIFGGSFNNSFHKTPRRNGIMSVNPYSNQMSVSRQPSPTN